ncbi:hypothetical protein O1C77_003055 [Vibrio cholerae]|uniref:hypothetical protein n=1 Tax=Vibrio cholerae TaxID=666 RepID=UPI00206A706F|nr:hypothetical protein [Vibrio cholerae]EKF9658963.1 hypothetical protein [Vibrio cholerae]EKF9677842.1 hypothetical protein [Vibrio cholerae]BCN17233.1 putative O-antigen polymerase [Vibrio cholerae]GHY95892.1 hypothetical protein VCSRO121_2954 [Vibrio cholerae]
MTSLIFFTILCLIFILVIQTRYSSLFCYRYLKPFNLFWFFFLSACFFYHIKFHVEVLSIALLYVVIFVFSFNVTSICLDYALKDLTFNPRFKIKIIPEQLFYFVAVLLSFVSIFKGVALLEEHAFSLHLVREDIADGNSIGAGVSFPALMSAIFISNKYNRRYVMWILIMLAILVVILNSSKLFLFLLFIFIAGLGVVKIKAKWMVPLAFFSFMVINFAQGKIESDVNVLNVAYVQFLVYLTGSMFAFSNYLDGGVYFESMYMIKDLLKSFGFHDRNLIGGGWSDIVASKTNVYTAFTFWINSFGVFFIFVFSMFLSILHTIFSRINSLSTEFFRLYLLFPLFMIFYSDLYFRGGKIMVIYVLFAILISFSYKVNIKFGKVSL